MCAFSPDQKQAPPAGIATRSDQPGPDQRTTIKAGQRQTSGRTTHGDGQRSPGRTEGRADHRKTRRAAHMRLYRAPERITRTRTHGTRTGARMRPYAAHTTPAAKQAGPETHPTRRKAHMDGQRRTHAAQGDQDARTASRPRTTRPGHQEPETTPPEDTTTPGTHHRRQAVSRSENEHQSRRKAGRHPEHTAGRDDLTAARTKAQPPPGICNRKTRPGHAQQHPGTQARPRAVDVSRRPAAIATM